MATTDTTLTARQLEIGRLIARGLTNGEIAYELSVSPSTIRQTSDVLRRKLGVARRRQIGQALRDRGEA